MIQEGIFSPNQDCLKRRGEIRRIWGCPHPSEPQEKIGWSDQGSEGRTEKYPPMPNLNLPKERCIMRKGIFFMFITLALILGSSLSFAADAGTKDEAVAMVKKAIDYIKANGNDKAFAEFSNPKGQFKDRDLYIVVYDMNMKCLAHGQKKSMVGKELLEFKDVDGKEYMKERQGLMKANKTAWQNYKFMNPVSKKIQPKEMYLEKYGDLVIGCGVYKK
jgi:cytochrome c